MSAESADAGDRERYPRLRRSEREAEFSRVLAFSDGVFAIAITLLVLQLEVPSDASDLTGELADQIPDLFAFGLSFAVLGRVWWTFHHRLFAGLAEFDTGLISLNFLYLSLVTLVPFTSDVLGDHGEKPVAVIVYAVNLALLTLVGGAMVEYAFRRGLMQPDVEAQRRSFTGPSNWLVPVIFLLSIPVALLSPFAATMVWLVTLVVGPRAVRRWSGRGRSAPH